MPNQPLPQHTPRAVLMQFGHVLQQELLPRLEEENGRLSESLQLLISVMSLVPVMRFLPARKGRGRRARDRAALVTAFIAKAILNCPTTRDLISRLAVDQALRRLWVVERRGDSP